MDALEAIKTRRSTRKFKEDMPPRELLDKIIEAGPDTYVSLKYAIEASKKDGYAFSGLPERTPLERKGNPVTWVGSDDL